MLDDATIQLPAGSARLNYDSPSRANSRSSSIREKLSFMKADFADRNSQTMGGPGAFDSEEVIRSLDELQLLNRSMLMRLNDLDATGGLTRKLINMYFEFSAATLIELDQAIQNSSADLGSTEISRQLHSLKSSSANLGLERVSALLQKLEHNRDRTPEYLSLAAALVTEIEKGNAALKSWLKEQLNEH